MLFLLELAAGIFLTGAVAWLTVTVSPENISRCEKLCRNRVAGLLIALPCTLACVPLAIPVSPGFPKGGILQNAYGRGNNMII